MKHIFIVNPAAGKASPENGVLPQIREFVKSNDFDYEIHRTMNKQEIGSYCRERASSGEPVRFYACGGDGTICDVVNGIFGFDNAELAVIPCGTGNDFVKNFSNVKFFHDIKRQLEGTVVPCDVIKFNGGYSMNMLNIGADCEIVAKVPEVKAKRGISGPRAYIVAALDVLLHGPKYRMSYELDGETIEEDILLVAIGNGMFCGGGFKSCPTAKLNDGLMDIGIARPVTGAKLLKLLVKYHQGTHIQDKDAKDILTYISVDKFKLKAIADVRVSIDGEVEPFTESEFEIVPGAIKMVVPNGCEMINK